MRATHSLPADPGVMRQLNSVLVLEAVKSSGPMSRADLAKRTRLAKPTVSSIVESLLAAGSLIEVGEGKPGGGGGRRPTMLAFARRSHAVAGVHVGVGYTVVALADGVGREIVRDTFATPRDPDQATEAIIEATRTLARRARLARSKILGLGICIPGLVHPEEGRCVLAPNLGWRDFEVGPRLEKTLGIPAFVHNVVQATVVAEQREGAAAGARVSAVLYDDNGIGAALAIDGRVFHGASGVAGELGHARIPGQLKLCTCGGTGCLETVASSRALVEQAQHIVGEVTPDTVFSALSASSDPRARALLDEAAEWLGLAAAWLVTVTNPNVLILAGELIKAGPRFVESVAEKCRSAILPGSNEGLQITESALGPDAPVRGAVLLALQASDSAVRLAFGS